MTLWSLCYRKGFWIYSCANSTGEDHWEAWGYIHSKPQGCGTDCVLPIVLWAECDHWLRTMRAALKDHGEAEDWGQLAALETAMESFQTKETL